ncbi:hypothetical protein [Yersinia vastinensis]|uniref:hypothetical protein n=1 Tax=Yersinia vastinensis TaxID=2890318 RepID=UPI0011A2CA9E|nr:hypothetical protein [Yersinia vastinensis]
MSFSQLISYSLDRKTRKTEAVYFTQHASNSVKIVGKNSYSILDQELIITGDLSYQHFTARMDMGGFPKDFGSEREAALKLAEWLQRMGAAIEDYWSEQ